LCLLFCFSLGTAIAQQDTSATAPISGPEEDNPSDFINRLEIFNKIQQLQNNAYLDVTTVRAIVGFGHNFTTRLDVPLVYNSTYIPGYVQYGIGDISLRLLGYRIFKSPRSALLTSVEFSFNTAGSPLLGTGKNILIPVVAYSWIIPKTRSILAISLQEYYSLWGNRSRQDISYTRVQGYYIQMWSKKVWTVVLPDLFIDYIKGGASMNLEAASVFRFKGRFIIWGKLGAGLFGDFFTRYQWASELGFRYLFMRKPKQPSSR
jgi:hypothetical protein